MPIPSEFSAPKSHDAFHWQPNWWVIIFGLVFLPILLSLAHWQWQRGIEKSIQLSEIQTRLSAPVQSIDKMTPEQLATLPAYTRVVFTGSADNERVLLVDNRTFQGRFGYQVAQIAKHDAGWILISRGWQAGSLRRSERPTITPLKANGQFSGRVVFRSEHPLLSNSPLDSDFPMRFNQLDLSSLSDHLGVEIIQWIELDVESYGALTVSWADVNVSPAKHYGYAVQWLCMAIALLILLLFANSNIAAVFRKKTPKNAVKSDNE
ncbi:SURF1 family protein [Simiduia aestuariiviva]|uniref:SURF1-like protein n=1 Tax=Simiduia aestuariiviva TaxID=1510459 RepID=A0A839USV1_9GAMM|nr:SURF1 family protein [Simiduia aestuariiviva]MBB3169791.1 cytochrome oxidase assembly protein ShyY1 [Simiduia aestuariiviva]